MFGRFTWFATAIIAAFSPALVWAQQFDPQMPGPYAMPGYAAPPPGPPGYGDYAYGRTRYTEQPDDLGFLYGDEPLIAFFRETFRHAFFRLEWLDWDIRDPGNVVLGAPILNPGLNINNPIDVNQPFRDPRQPFDVFDPGSGLLLGEGVSPVLDDVKLNHNNGIRGTWGFRFEPFSIEASVFALQSNRSTVFAGDLPVVPTIDALGFPTFPLIGTFVAQGVLVDGVDTLDSYLVYDQSYQADLRTQVWGADAKIVMAPVDPNHYLTIQPLVGVRFLNFNERLNQKGDYRTPLVTGTAASTVTRTIDSETRNYLYGPQFGGRFELPSKYITLGAEPTIMFGVNNYKATLATDNISSGADPAAFIRQVGTTFGPVASLQAYCRGNISETITLFVSYDLMWAGMLTRPADNIVYNVTGAAVPQPGAFQQDILFTDLLLQGVSVGGEVHW